MARSNAQPDSRPAIPISEATPQTLNAASFQSAQQVISRRSAVAKFRVPKGTIYELDGDMPFRLMVRARVDFDVPANSDGSYTVDIGDLGVDLVRSARPAPSGATTRHPDAKVLLDGEVVAVEAFDADANTLTITVPDADAHSGVAYVLHGNGDIRLIATLPSGVDVREIELYNDTFQALHETDQANGRTAPRLTPGKDLPLGPQWELQLQVTSDAVIEWSAQAGHVIALRGYSAPVAVVSREALNQIIAGRLI